MSVLRSLRGHVLGGVLVPALAVGLQGQASTVETGVTAVVDVTVIPMDRDRVLPHQTVVVRAGRVTAVGDTKQVRVPAGAVRVDGRGKFLVPGLADMHTHVAAFDSAGVEDALFLWLAAGVTTIRNVDYTPVANGGGFVKQEGAALLRLRARLAAGTVPGPRMYTSGAWVSGEVQTQEQVAQAVAKYQAAGYDFIKAHDEPPITYGDLMAAARTRGIPVMGHVPRGVPLAEALAAHQASIEHLTGYEAAFADAAKIPALAEATSRAGVWNCPTLLHAELFGVGMTHDSAAHLPGVSYAAPGALEFSAQADAKIGTDTLLRVKRQLVKALQNAGGRLLVGTDAPGPYLMPGFSVHWELAALVRAGLTPYQALAAATRNVAEFFGTRDSSGTIAVGKSADLVLLDANPLTAIQATTQIAGVMRAGRWFSRAALDQRLATLRGTVTFGF